ncbi:uncharacterized protein LOC120331758 isoform X2 [Styela clava]
MPSRVGLSFCKPPALMPEADKFILAIEKDFCETIYDLQQLIKYRFKFSRKSNLHLEIDGFVLLPSNPLSVVKEDEVLTVCYEQEKSYSRKRANTNNIENVNSSRMKAAKLNIMNGNHDKAITSHCLHADTVNSAPNNSSSDISKSMNSSFQQADDEIKIGSTPENVFRTILECDGYPSCSPEDSNKLSDWLKSGINNMTKKFYEKNENEPAGTFDTDINDISDSSTVHSSDATMIEQKNNQT